MIPLEPLGITSNQDIHGAREGEGEHRKPKKCKLNNHTKEEVNICPEPGPARSDRYTD